MEYQTLDWPRADCYNRYMLASLNYENTICSDTSMGAWDDTCSSSFAAYNNDYRHEDSPVSTFSDQSEDYFGSHSISPQISEVPPMSSTSSRPSGHDTLPDVALPLDAPKRKRGRPKLHHHAKSASSESSNASNSPRPSNRTPHHLVESKYRQGLNHEMERLRLAIPETAYWAENGGSCAPGKPPSKATVLACAVSYIRQIEEERDCLLEQIALLRR